MRSSKVMEIQQVLLACVFKTPNQSRWDDKTAAKGRSESRPGRTNDAGLIGPSLRILPEAQAVGSNTNALPNWGTPGHPAVAQRGRDTRTAAGRVQWHSGV